jgi:hypothetical protein
MEHSLDTMRVKWERVEGYFEGVSENSYMVTATNHYGRLLALAAAHNQDSVLYISAYKGATLVPVCRGIAGGELFLGELVTSSEKPNGDYSFNYLTKEYYFIREGGNNE